MENLRLLGDPKTIIDIGVGYGTGSLYRSFPNTKIVLVEALQEYKERLQEICKQYDAVYYLTAASDRTGTLTMHVDPDFIQRSSAHQRTALTRTESKLVIREVPSVRMDEIMGEYEPPYGIKVDTEGGEMVVLKGCTGILDQTMFLILEASVARRFKRGYAFHELVVFLAEYDFYLFDILHVTYKKNQPGVSFVDAVFVNSKYYDGQ